MFDSIAPRYDLLNHVLSAGSIGGGATRRSTRWRSPRARGCSISARDGGPRARGDARVPGARVLGVDFSSEMLRRGWEGRAGEHARAIRLVRGDASRIPAASGSATP
jgi:demethylmenaquinone methyltransferase / 2-methoxy-6-polyprenyl-1,4-benzoquinol methylase